MLQEKFVLLSRKYKALRERGEGLLFSLNANEYIPLPSFEISISLPAQNGERERGKNCTFIYDIKKIID